MRVSLDRMGRIRSPRKRREEFGFLITEGFVTLCRTVQSDTFLRYSSEFRARACPLMTD